jgi:hypothetical protein
MQKSGFFLTKLYSIFLGKERECDRAYGYKGWKPLSLEEARG